MVKVKEPEKVFPKIIDEYRKVFGEELLSIILYGSGASGHYLPGKSDLNILIVILDDSLDKLIRTIPSIEYWRPKGVHFIFMREDFIRSSVDSYPVELLNFKLNHRILYGKDVFSALNFDHRDLRLQLERELKGKIFHLRHGFLEGRGKGRSIRELIILSLRAFFPLFKAFLYLQGYEIPHGRRDVIKALSLACPELVPEVFLSCIDIREGKARMGERELKNLFSDYLREIIKFSCFVDRLKV